MIVDDGHIMEVLIVNVKVFIQVMVVLPIMIHRW